MPVALNLRAMWTILLALALGTCCGWLLRQRRRWLLWADRATGASVYLLLFVLGMSVGMNTAVVDALPALGMQAFWLSVSGVAGSLLFALLLNRWIFREAGHNEG